MSNITVIETEELKKIIDSVIQQSFVKFANWIESKIVENEKPLTATEAWEYLSISKSTFYRYVNQGIIPKYGLGDRTYYKLSDLDKAMIRIN